MEDRLRAVFLHGRMPAQRRRPIVKLAVLSHVAEKFRRAVEPICLREGIALVSGEHPDMLSESERAGIDLVLADPPFAAEALRCLPGLRWLQSTWTGVDRILADELARERARQIPLTGLHGVHAEIIADYVSAYVLAVHRNLFVHWEAQKGRIWKFRPYERLRGREVCFIGTGAIATGVAERLEGMGLVPLGISRRGVPRAPFRQTATVEDRHALLARADVVVSVLPLTPESRSMVDGSWFSVMKKKPLFLNVGRGPTVCEADLVEALRTGLLSGAVLDVFEEEPLSVDSPLWDMANVVITPHVAGITFVEDIVAAWEANFLRWKAGEPLVALIDPDRGY